MIDASSRQSLIEFSDLYLAPYSIKTSGNDEKLIPDYCPFCHGGSNNKDKHTFCLFLNNGAFVCKRGACARHGRFDELSKELSGKEIKLSNTGISKKSDKQFVLPSSEVFPPTEQVYKYFETRKISRETVDAMKIGADKDGNIVFRFFWNGEEVFRKYRKPQKPGPKERKEWQDPGTKAILYNMDNVVFSQPLVITEGMIDMLSLYEAGITNAVSVPSGCDNNDWITYCYDWLEKFHTIILFGDNDPPGHRAIENWTKKLG
ncbi:MAG: toprim domain-containing protein, partial [Erysipelotrichaceae bacterium]|nr:toprim domain-containing protein [Erysipelotrichaceae bacterium]